MIRLVRVEVARLLARRLLRALLLLVLLALVIVLGKTAHDSAPPNAAARAHAAQQAAQANMPPLAVQRAQCEQTKRQNRSNGLPASFNCNAITVPTAADFLPNTSFRFSGQIRSRITTFGGVLALFGFVLGAGFAGAEWAAGTFAALLTWEPRRLRVLGAKTLAVAGVLAVVGVAVLVIDIGGHYGVAVWRGYTEHATAGLWASLILAGLRAVALGISAALVGQALAGITRSTAAAVGTGFAYAIVGEAALRHLWAGANHWLLSTHIAAWLQDGTQVPRNVCSANGDCSFTISIQTAALYLGVLIVAVAVIDAIVLHRRDIS